MLVFLLLIEKGVRHYTYNLVAKPDIAYLSRRGIMLRDIEEKRSLTSITQDRLGCRS